MEPLTTKQAYGELSSLGYKGIIILNHHYPIDRGNPRLTVHSFIAERPGDGYSVHVEVYANKDNSGWFIGVDEYVHMHTYVRKPEDDAYTQLT